MYVFLNLSFSIGITTEGSRKQGAERRKPWRGGSVLHRGSDLRPFQSCPLQQPICSLCQEGRLRQCPERCLPNYKDQARLGQGGLLLLLLSLSLISPLLESDYFQNVVILTLGKASSFLKWNMEAYSLLYMRKHENVNKKMGRQDWQDNEYFLENVCVESRQENQINLNDMFRMNKRLQMKDWRSSLQIRVNRT